MEENKTTVNTPTAEVPDSMNGSTPPAAPPVQAHGTQQMPPPPPPHAAARPTYPQYRYPAPAPKQPKPGFGFNIVSMILGIVTLLSGVSGISDAVQILYDSFDFEEMWFESLGYVVSENVANLIIAIVCIIFGVIGYRKKENYGRSMGLSGLICGSVGFVCLVVSLIILLLCG